MQPMQELLQALRATNVTRVVHDTPYAAILPTRPELSQSGRTVLITGGGGVLGLAIGKAFVQAHAGTVILTGRRASALETAVSELEQKASLVGSKTKIIAKTCDMADVNAITAFWQKLKEAGVSVDVYINNAASFSDETTLLDLGAEQVWYSLDVNARGPLFFTDEFCKQSAGNQKVPSNRTSFVASG